MRSSGNALTLSQKLQSKAIHVSISSNGQLFVNMLGCLDLTSFLFCYFIRRQLMIFLAFK